LRGTARDADDDHVWVAPTERERLVLALMAEARSHQAVRNRLSRRLLTMHGASKG